MELSEADKWVKKYIWGSSGEEYQYLFKDRLGRWKIISIRPTPPLLLTGWYWRASITTLLVDDEKKGDKVQRWTIIIDDPNHSGPEGLEEVKKEAMKRIRVLKRDWRRV